MPKPSVELAELTRRTHQLEDAAELVRCLESAAAARAVAPFRCNVVLEPTGYKRRVTVIGDAGVIVAQADGTPRVLAAVAAFEEAGGRVAYAQRQVKKRGAR